MGLIIPVLHIFKSSQSIETSIVKTEKAQRSLKKFNVKHIYFVNNSPDTIGAGQKTIPRIGIPRV